MRFLLSLAATLCVCAVSNERLHAQDPSVAHKAPRISSTPEGLRGDCVSPSQLVEGLNAIRVSRLSELAFEPRDLPRVPFIPIGATLYADLLPPGYMDHDATSPGYRDYSCNAFTYDGHAGTDLGLHSFAEQDVGVPVFSALDGIVVYSHDGEPDKSTCLCGAPANALIIDHGNGLYGWYWHFRTSTVAYQVGQHVVAGAQLGLAGSSGNSGGPHLHLGFADVNGNPNDPFSGPCGGPGLWTNQPALDLHTYIADFGFSTQNLGGLPYYPYAFPNTGQMGFDEYLWFWAQVVNLPPHSTWRQKYIQPNGGVAFDSGSITFEANQTDFYRVGNWWWYSYYIWQMREMAGVWRIQLLINEEIAIDAPLVVKPVADPNFNRPPAPIGAHFEPAAPIEGDVVFARVDAPLALDDPDYDRVRYHYVWKRNGTTVRDVTWAGRGDAMPRTAFAAGDIITCVITPSDGKVNGPGATITVTMAAACRADFNGDQFLDFTDFDDFVGAFEAGLGTSDFNGDGFLDFTDFDDFVGAFEAGC